MMVPLKIKLEKQQNMWNNETYLYYSPDEIL